MLAKSNTTHMIQNKWYAYIDIPWTISNVRKTHAYEEDGWEEAGDVHVVRGPREPGAKLPRHEEPHHSLAKVQTEH